MYGNNIKRLRTRFRKVEGQGGGCQFMVTTCFASLCVEANGYLQLASNNPNSLDGNFFVRSTEGELEVVTNF